MTLNVMIGVSSRYDVGENAGRRTPATAPATQLSQCVSRWVRLEGHATNVLSWLRPQGCIEWRATKVWPDGIEGELSAHRTHLSISQPSCVYLLCVRLTPLIIRGLAVTTGQFATYDQAKETLIGTFGFKGVCRSCSTTFVPSHSLNAARFIVDDLPAHFCSSLAAGLVAACVSYVDVLTIFSVCSYLLKRNFF